MYNTIVLVTRSNVPFLLYDSLFCQGAKDGFKSSMCEIVARSTCPKNKRQKRKKGGTGNGTHIRDADSFNTAWRERCAASLGV